MTPIELRENTETSVKTIDKKIVASSRIRSSRRVKSGMFDAPEIIAVSLAGAALLGVVFAYFLMLLPARAEFKKAESERSQKQTQLLDLQAKAQAAGTNAAGTVDLMSSVDRFETNFLPVPANGNAALYQRLNELIRANNLRNVAGPEYSALESVEPERAAKTENRRNNNKQPGIFPGTYVTVTVEGSYAALRHFINDLESTRQFLVINTVEIEPNGSDANLTNNAPVAQTPDNPDSMPNGFPDEQMQPNKINPRLSGNPSAASPAPAPNPAKRGSVSLQLEMAAYFRRPATAQN